MESNDPLASFRGKELVQKMNAEIQQMRIQKKIQEDEIALLKKKMDGLSQKTKQL